MPNKNYIRGRKFEWDLKKYHEADGWEVYRTAGSHGPFDLIEFHKGTHEVRLIQCKTKLVDSPKEDIISEQVLRGLNWTVTSHKHTKFIRRKK